MIVHMTLNILLVPEFARRGELQPNLYSYSELKIATNDFSSDMRLGQGGFGVVYKVRNIQTSSCAISHFASEIISLGT